MSKEITLEEARAVLEKHAIEETNKYYEDIADKQDGDKESTLRGVSVHKLSKKALIGGLIEAVENAISYAIWGTK